MEDIISSQKEVFGINSFLESASKYSKETFPDLDISELFTNSLSGNAYNIFSFENLKMVLLPELNTALNLMVNIIAIIIIHSIFKAIIENLKSTNSSQIIYFIQYLLIVTVIIKSFSSMISITKENITNIINFMNLLIPLMTTLMLTTGCITTTTIIEPLLILMINFMGTFINSFIIPILMISITVSIVSNISDKIQLNKLSNIFKSSIVWILGIILTIFSCTLSLEGTLTSSVDGLTAKTAKSAVTNFIPVVGKIMGDTVDSVIGCGNILKNSVGIIGIIIILSIVISPIIKVLTLWISFKLTAAVCETVADSKVIKLLDNIADSYKILLAILFSVSIMFIIGITIVLKITNGIIMYR